MTKAVSVTGKFKQYYYCATMGILSKFFENGVNKPPPPNTFRVKQHDSVTVVGRTGGGAEGQRTGEAQSKPGPGRQAGPVQRQVLYTHWVPPEITANL